MAVAAAVGCGGGDCPDDDAPGVGSGDVSSFFVRRLFVEVLCMLALFCAAAVSMAVAAGDGACAGDGDGAGAVGAGVGTMGEFINNYTNMDGSNLTTLSKTGQTLHITYQNLINTLNLKQNP